MANIFLTHKCNLKCPYCFADEFVNKEDEEISVENFKLALEFIKTGQERTGLIGGEPLLHSHFAELIKIILEDSRLDDVTIYTNGLLIDRYIEELSNKKISVLVNCNSPKDTGESNFEKLKKNLLLLNEKSKGTLNLGINLYSKNMDYSYIFELLHILDKHNLRISLAYQNACKTNSVNALDSFRQIKPLLFDFFRKCINNDIVPHTDCNSIPACLLDVGEKKILLQIELLASVYHINSTISTVSACVPPIDILPNLMAVRCFGLSDYLKKDIREFANIRSLRYFFFNSIDIFAKLVYESQDCKECKNRLINKCGICYSYKLQKAEQIKNLINSNINNFD